MRSTPKHDASTMTAMNHFSSIKFKQILNESFNSVWKNTTLIVSHAVILQNGRKVVILIHIDFE